MELLKEIQAKQDMEEYLETIKANLF